MSYRTYTKEQFCQTVLESKSISEILRKLNLRTCGGNYGTVHRKITEYQLDTSHFTGKLWSKGKRLKDFKDYNRVGTFKKHLLKEKGHMCEACGLSEWMEKKIPLECHHIDGDRTNNSLINLQLLCPNCHAQTHNYRNQKRDMV